MKPWDLGFSFVLPQCKINVFSFKFVFTKRPLTLRDTVSILCVDIHVRYVFPR